RDRGRPQRRRAPLSPAGARRARLRAAGRHAAEDPRGVSKSSDRRARARRAGLRLRAGANHLASEIARRPAASGPRRRAGGFLVRAGRPRPRGGRRAGALPAPRRGRLLGARAHPRRPRPLERHPRRRGFGLATRGAQADYRRYAASSSAELPVDGAELAARGRAGDSLAAVTTGALIASGAAALATLAMIPWVDWSDR